jgi:hypothetical protein
MTLALQSPEVLDVLPAAELQRIVRRDREHERHREQPWSLRDVPAARRETILSSRGTIHYGLPRDQVHV